MTKTKTSYMKQNPENSKIIVIYVEGRKYVADWSDVNMMLLDSHAIAELKKTD